MIYDILTRVPVDGIEASQLGWKPGSWPYEFEYQGKRMIRFQTDRDLQHEVVAVRYVSFDNPSLQLDVFND